MIGCLPRVLEVSRVVDDTEVRRILWVKCATPEGCKTIRIAVSTIKDSWVITLGLRPLIYKPLCVCLDKWGKLLGSSQRTWHDRVGLMPTSFMSISVTSPYGYLNSYDTWFTNCWTCHSTIKLASCKIYLYHALLYLEPKHGLLASIFKVLIGLPLVILLARHGRAGLRGRVSWWRTCELGCFPIRMPVGLRQMAWVLLINEDFRCVCFLSCSALEASSM